MTKKDFEVIAKALKSAEPPDYSPHRKFWADLCKTMAYRLSTTNARFKVEMFLGACNLQPKER